MIRSILRMIGALVLMTAIGIGVLLLVARFYDGPLAIVAGGPLTSGELHSGLEPDWSFARDLDTVEFQLLNPPRSRTTWILEHDGRLFIPSGYMDTAIGRIWKHWPIEAERDGRALLRVAGRRYQTVLVRVRDHALIEPLVGELNRKYGMGATPEMVAAGSLWLFELKPRH